MNEIVIFDQAEQVREAYLAAKRAGALMIEEEDDG